MSETNMTLGPFVTNEFGDRYIYEVNRSAFNRVGSDALYAKVFGNGFFQEDTLHIVIGTDSGLLPNHVLKHGVPDGSRFLFVEFPELIDRIKGSVFSEKNESGIVITTYDNWRKKAEQLDLTNYTFINKVVLQQSVGTMDANIPAYHELYWAVSQELTRFIWENQARLGTQAFVVRQLENLAENRHSSSCLENAFKGKTAVLLGGGPSLDGIISWLKTNRDRVVILAVSRICRRLLECGLKPHMVFSVDPQPISFDISKQLFHFWRETLFVHAYHVSPPLLAQWRGKSVFSGPRFPWKTALNVETLPSAGPTVTNEALSSAVAMGFSRVLLAGVDLCFSREGYSHAQGSYEHKLGPELGRMGLKVETNGGWMAETRPDYASAISIIERQAKHALEKGCKVINTAPGAAKIQNISYAHPDEIAIEALQEPPEDTIARILPVDSRAERIAHYQDVLNELAKGKARLKKIRKLAAEALKCTDRLPARRGTNTGTGFYTRMNKIEKTLNRKYQDFVPLVKQFGIRNFLRVIRPGEKEGYIEESDRISRLRTYYQAYRESAKTLTALIENAGQRLHARLEEENDTPDMVLLIDQWKRDRQPGRYLVWKERNPDAEKRARLSHGNALKELEHEFKNIMEEKETRQMRVMREKINLSGVRGKASALFQKRDIDELERLAEGLIHNAHPRAKTYLYLIRGYLAELHENREAALESYHELLSEDTDEAVLEDALRRTAFICIDNRDLENAVFALQCLSQLSPSYAPQYADILRLTGDKEAAAGVYSDYLQKVPDDLGTMLKLGNLYKDMHADEAARMAFTYVLEHDPNNSAAKALLER